MNKFLTWCGRRAIESWTVIQWTLIGALIGLIIAGTVITFVHYVSVLLVRWVV